jgi:hypothetical protein
MSFRLDRFRGISIKKRAIAELWSLIKWKNGAFLYFWTSTFYEIDVKKNVDEMKGKFTQNTWLKIKKKPFQRREVVCRLCGGGIGLFLKEYIFLNFLYTTIVHVKCKKVQCPVLDE